MLVAAWLVRHRAAFPTHPDRRRLRTAVIAKSLWRYNDKYHPIWRPRYVLLSRQPNLPVQGWAIAEAEGATELPVLRRLLGQ